MGAALACCGNLLAAGILLTGDVAASLITFCTQNLAGAVDRLCGSGKNTARRKVAWHGQRYSTDPVHVSGSHGGFGALDVDATMARSTFPIKPDKLINAAKDVLASEFGTAEGADGSCLADDFQFVAPIIGPLSKREFMGIWIVQTQGGHARPQGQLVVHSRSSRAKSSLDVLPGYWDAHGDFEFRIPDRTDRQEACFAPPGSKYALR